MKITLLNVGIEEGKKITKIVHISSIKNNFDDFEDFALCEIEMHLPPGEVEIVPADGLDPCFSKKFTIVFGGYRGVGMLLLE